VRKHPRNAKKQTRRSHTAPAIRQANWDRRFFALENMQKPRRFAAVFAINKRKGKNEKEETIIFIACRKGSRYFLFVL